MGTVQAQAIMSLDGYVAKQDNTIGRLFDWLQNGEVAIPTPAGDFTVHLSPPSAEHWRRWVVLGWGRWSAAARCSTWPMAGRAGTPWTSLSSW